MEDGNGSFDGPGWLEKSSGTRYSDAGACCGRLQPSTQRHQPARSEYNGKQKATRATEVGLQPASDAHRG